MSLVFKQEEYKEDVIKLYKGPPLSIGLDATFKTVPFYYSKKIDDRLYSITIATQVAGERLERLSWMADKWRAPISASVYIHTQEDINAVDRLISSSYSVYQFVDIHLLYSNNTRYPVNNLRNLSIRNSNTKWQIMMDIDFLPPIDLYEKVLKHIRSTNNELVAYVIPSFASSLSRFELPDDKETFIKYNELRTIKPTNLDVCPKCHGPTNYPEWFIATEPYEATYKWVYEPFLVFRKDMVDPYDERLKGYGFDKSTHTFGMAVQGYKFIVLNDCWIVHINHPNILWEGTDTMSEQLWDSLKIVCDILPSVKEKWGYKREEQRFNEPLQDTCYTRGHW